MLMNVNSDVEAAASAARTNTEDSLVLARWDLSVPEMDIVSEDNSDSNNKYHDSDSAADTECHHHQTSDTDNPHKPTPSASNVCPVVIPRDEPVVQ